MQKKLFVGGLPYSTQQEEVEQLFSQCGQVLSATIVRDKFTNQSRGFGFVEMSTEEEAAEAINRLNGTQMGGRTIVVNESRPKEMRSNSGSNDGRGRSRFNNQRRGGFRS
jgi:RNA recognition motif-containing protein